jgi:dipeptidyl aminopeptidase/acylaminoacyl peptidase
VAPNYLLEERRISKPASGSLGLGGTRLMKCFVMVLLLEGRTGFSSWAAPTIEDFAANDAVEMPQVSPDGTEIAYLNSSGRDIGLAIYHLDTGKGEILCRVDSHTNAFAWKGNDRILYFENTLGTGYLRSVSPGKSTLNTFPGFGTSRRLPAVMDWLPGDDGHILVRTKRIGIMDVMTGAITETQPTDALTFVGPYIHDRKGTLRLRCIQRRDGIELQHRENDADAFVMAHRWTWDEPSVYFLGFAEDPEVCYFLTSTDGDWGEVRPFNTRTCEIGSPVAKGDGAQIIHGVFSRDQSRLTGVEISDQNGANTLWLDGTMQRRQASLDAALPGCHNVIASVSKDESILVILSTLNGDPGTYFALDAKHGTLKRLGRKHPLLDPDKLARPKALEIPARDGLSIHALLALPPGSQGPVPLVLIPQPNLFSTRAGVYYFPLLQFLASRGYGVLEVDYRGSRGYGKTYEDAGRHQMARKIPDDIDDAASWSVANGYAYKGRICLFGIDTGAMEALIAATRSPEQYACVVNEGGAPDFRYIADTGDYDWLVRKQTEQYFSDDKGTLAESSALAAIGRLRGPILNIYENADRNDEWLNLKAGLKAANKTFFLFKNLDPNNQPLDLDYRENYYRQIEEFLKANFPPSAGVDSPSKP